MTSPSKPARATARFDSARWATQAGQPQRPGQPAPGPGESGWRTAPGGGDRHRADRRFHRDGVAPPGWWVSGTDRDPAGAQRAPSSWAPSTEVGMDRLPPPPSSPCLPGRGRASPRPCFPTTPGRRAATSGDLAARTGARVVTDVAGIKEGIVSAVGHPRFVGGPPHGRLGARRRRRGRPRPVPRGHLGADAGPAHLGRGLLRGAGAGALFGANPVAVDPRRHDELVALVSHTPHLTAAALMNLAADAAASDATLLRLAAGGFRDMTRIAAGHPGIWPDVVAENQDAIWPPWTGCRRSLDKLRAIVAGGTGRGSSSSSSEPGRRGSTCPRGRRRSGRPARCASPSRTARA